MRSDAHLARLIRGVFPGADVKLRPQLLGSENRHADVTLAGGDELFIKFYAHVENCAVERLVLDALEARYTWPIAPLAAGHEGAVAWQAFPHLELAAVEPGRAVFEECAIRLGELHLCPPPPSLERSRRAVDVVQERLDRLTASQFQAAGAAVELWDRARGSQGARAARHHEPSRLLTNDFGLRNAARRPDGRIALIDFERSGAGDPHWELGKAWDRELQKPDDANAFITAYRSVIPGTRHWPHEPTLWVTRFAAAIAAIPYAIKINDQPFLRHSITVLDRLATELT